MLNKLMLIGHLGTDPDMRYTPNGQAMATFRLAVNTRLGYDEGGLPREETEWFTVVVFGRQAETCAASLHKGARIFVEGRLRSRTFMGQDGHPRFQMQVVAQRVLFLSAPRQATAAAAEAPWPDAEEPLFPEEEEVTE